MAVSLSVHARHVGNRFRRADNNEGIPKKTDIGINPSNEFWLRNLVVGPPIGAPHITLTQDVRNNLDGDIADVIRHLNADNENQSENENNNLKQFVIDKKEEANEPRGSSEKPVEKTKSVNNVQASGENSSNNGTGNTDKNAQSDRNKKNREKVNKSTSFIIDVKSTAKDNADNGQETKKQDNNRSDTTKESKPEDSVGPARESKEQSELDEFSFSRIWIRFKWLKKGKNSVKHSEIHVDM